ncbi:hypothetical protein [Syntrophotalea acetylenivorans]|uniref:hypothetical protein n=1 Tax=Syntrophotalea acetylenivorans TaxID=1842532 RepID=UPI000ADCEDC6|nr:hypothetical protein [Syntrophotalea acetylenivorans]
MTEPAQPPETEQEQSDVEPIDEFEKLRLGIARQLRANQRFLETFFDEDFAEEENE